MCCIFLAGKQNDRQRHSPNNETSNFLVFSCRGVAREIGCILTRWIIAIHSDAARAATQRAIFLGSKHIRVWTPVMPTLQPYWYPVTTSSHNQNVRLERGGWIINAVSFGFAYFTAKKISFLPLLPAAQYLACLALRSASKGMMHCSESFFWQTIT